MNAPTYAHPAFPQPSDPNAVLWRYMDICKFKWLISEGRLLMPVATQLGDPFEGTTPQGELNWWREEASRAASEEQRAIIEQNRVKLSGFARAFQGHYYASCWHMNRHENYAMWGTYTKSPESLAIQTTLPALRDCLPDYVYIGVVRYIDYSTERLPTMNMFEYIMHKRVHFEFEQEVRVVASDLLPEPLGGAHMREHLFDLNSSPDFWAYAPPIDVRRLIQSIVIHPKATPDFAAMVAAYCVDNALPPAKPSAMNQSPSF